MPDALQPSSDGAAVDQPTTSDGADTGPVREAFDIPEWVSEVRRLYVEPKTRAQLREAGLAPRQRRLPGIRPSRRTATPAPPVVTPPVADSQPSAVPAEPGPVAPERLAAAMGALTPSATTPVPEPASAGLPGPSGVPAGPATTPLTPAMAEPTADAPPVTDVPRRDAPVTPAGAEAPAAASFSSDTRPDAGQAGAVGDGASGSVPGVHTTPEPSANGSRAPRGPALQPWIPPTWGTAAPSSALTREDVAAEAPATAVAPAEPVSALERFAMSAEALGAAVHDPAAPTAVPEPDPEASTRQPEPETDLEASTRQPEPQPDIAAHDLDVAASARLLQPDPTPVRDVAPAASAEEPVVQPTLMLPIVATLATTPAAGPDPRVAGPVLSPPGVRPPAEPVAMAASAPSAPMAPALATAPPVVDRAPAEVVPAVPDANTVANDPTATASVIATLPSPSLEASATTVAPVPAVEASTEATRSRGPGRPHTVPAVNLSWREADSLDLGVPLVDDPSGAIVLEPPSQLVANTRRQSQRRRREESEDGEKGELATLADETGTEAPAGDEVGTGSTRSAARGPAPDSAVVGSRLRRVLAVVAVLVVVLVVGWLARGAMGSDSAAPATPADATVTAGAPPLLGGPGGSAT